MVDSANILHVKQTDEGVLRLTMDDQRTRNALSEGMMAVSYTHLTLPTILLV